MLFQEKTVSAYRIDRGNRKEDSIQKRSSQGMKKTERKGSQKGISFLNPPKSRMKAPGKASLCASFSKWRHASLTVEAALVLPLFFMGVIAMISFMDIYRMQTVHLTNLCQKAKEAGMYAYVLDGSGTEEISLPDMYSYTPVGGMLPLPKVRMYNLVKVHAWTGEAHGGFKNTGEGKAEAMVWVAESGEVYHKNPSCSYLDLSLKQASGKSISSLRNDYGEKYYACEACSRNQKPAWTVYITGKGNRFHNHSSCSGLKRSVRLVRESEAKKLRLCSRCG